jgi:hypothetical protein
MTPLQRLKILIHLAARFRTEGLMGFNGIAKCRENEICVESALSHTAQT